MLAKGYKGWRWISHPPPPPALVTARCGTSGLFSVRLIMLSVILASYRLACAGRTGFQLGIGNVIEPANS